MGSDLLHHLNLVVVNIEQDKLSRILLSVEGIQSSIIITADDATVKNKRINIS